MQGQSKPLRQTGGKIRPFYSHSQSGHLLRWMIIPSALGLVAAGYVGGKGLLFLSLALVLGGLGWAFSSLTVEVSAMELAWFFGPGVWRKFSCAAVSFSPALSAAMCASVNAETLKVEVSSLNTFFHHDGASPNHIVTRSYPASEGRRTPICIIVQITRGADHAQEGINLCPRVGLSEATAHGRSIA